jgi:hypothetical protein
MSRNNVSRRLAPTPRNPARRRRHAECSSPVAMKRTNTKKLKIDRESIRRLGSAELRAATGGNWTDGWCDFTMSGGYVCASFHTYCSYPP